MTKPRRCELIEILNAECIKQHKKILGLKNLKLLELKEAAERLGINILDSIIKLRRKKLEEEGLDVKDITPTELDWAFGSSEPIPIEPDYFNDKEKRMMFINMYKKDYSENKEKNRTILRDAKGTRINKNTFNNDGIIITYGLLPECAEEEDFDVIKKEFNIKVKNGEVTFKM
jgi:hypothetical protein